nr:HNH endonuclease [Bacillus cereus]
MAERCIFCRGMKEDFNIEHVFPDGIGGHFTINRVCISCNSRLGSQVDHHLTNHILMVMLRNQYNIRGKKGALPPVVKYGELANDREQKVHFSTNSDGIIDAVRLLPKKEIMEEKNGDMRILISGDKTDERAHRKSVNTLLKRKNLPEMTHEEYKDSLQSEQITSSINTTLSIDFSQYIRTIAKIAYEMTWHWLGDSYIDDPQAAIIRDYIQSGNLDNKHLFFKGAGMLKDEIKNKLAPELHLARLEINTSSIVCSVFISDTFSGEFIMSLNSSIYTPNFKTAALTNDIISGDVDEEFE